MWASTDAICRIVLTGGPCGGKTTAISQIARRIVQQGIHVFRVPEAATLLVGGGVTLRSLQPKQLVGLQSCILNTMMALEDAFADRALATQQPSVVFCDRGAMDGAAYVSQLEWRQVLRMCSVEHQELLTRYDGVIHLASAAHGGPEFYTLENNSARVETMDEARALDALVRDVWRDHANMNHVGFHVNFSQKVDKATAAVSRILAQHRASTERLPTPNVQGERTERTRLGPTHRSSGKVFKIV